MLRDAELANLREDALVFLPDLCTISRHIWVEASGGGFTGDLPTVIASNVPCRVGPVRSDNALEVVATNIEPDSVARVFVPEDVDVKAGDVITVVGKTYPVLGVAERSEQVTILKRVTVECRS